MAGGHQVHEHRVSDPTSPLAGSAADRRPDAAGGEVFADCGGGGRGEGAQGLPEGALRQHQGRAGSESE